MLRNLYLERDRKATFRSVILAACMISKTSNQSNTLFDDMIKNIENDKEYGKLVEAVVFGRELLFVQSPSRISFTAFKNTP